MTKKPKAAKAVKKLAAPKNADAPDNPRATPGDNALTDDQIRGLFLKHLEIYGKALDSKKRSDAALKNACKLIKAEGTALVDIKTAVKLQADDGEAAVRGEIEDTIKVARWMGASVGYQLDMFPDRRPASDKAFDEGKLAGLKGVPKKPPYDSSVPQFSRWCDGYNDGQAAMVRKMAPKAPAQQPKTEAPAPATALQAPAPPPEGGKPTLAGGTEGPGTSH